MIVTHVVNDRVEPIEFAKMSTATSIVDHFKAGRQISIRWMEAFYEKSYLSTHGKVREQLFAVVTDPGSLGTERAEVCEFHFWSAVPCHRFLIEHV